MNLNAMTQSDPMNATDEQLGAMSHGDLMLWRKMAEKSGNKALNIRLAPFEHQAFAREYVKENPVTGTIGVGAAIPLYQLAKLAGIAPTTGGTATPVSLAQMSQGFKGIGQGLDLGLVK